MDVISSGRWSNSLSRYGLLDNWLSLSGGSTIHLLDCITGILRVIVRVGISIDAGKFRACERPLHRAKNRRDLGREVGREFFASKLDLLTVLA